MPWESSDCPAAKPRADGASATPRLATTPWGKPLTALNCHLLRSLCWIRQSRPAKTEQLVKRSVGDLLTG